MVSPLAESRNLLLDLPSELRALILEELLTTSHNKHHVGEGFYRYKLYTNILRVNKQLYLEGIEVLTRQNTLIRIETPWTQAEEHVATEGQVPILATGYRADHCRLLSMSVQIDAPDVAAEFQGSEPSKFLLCLEDLPSFCKMWMYCDLTYPNLNLVLHVTLELRNPRNLISGTGSQSNEELPKALQSRLLEPFAMVKNLNTVKVKGPHDASIEESFHKAMAIPGTSPTHCLEKCSALKDAGNASLKANNPAAALAHYTAAFAAMHIVVAGRRRHIWADAFFNAPIESGIFANRDAGLVRMELRIKLVANCIAAYLNMKEWEEAKFWGMRSINLMRESWGGMALVDEPHDNFPARDSWGKIYYRTAMACKALEEMSEARALLRIAQAWLPNDEIVKKEVAACALRLG